MDGVASIQVAGQFVNEVQLKFNQDKLNELGLTEDTVKGIVQGSALYVPLGMFEMDKSQKAVAIDGGIIGIDDLKISLFRLFRAAAVHRWSRCSECRAGQQPSRPSGDAAQPTRCSWNRCGADQAVLLPFQLAFQP